jgi:hypothetical protein
MLMQKVPQTIIAIITRSGSIGKANFSQLCSGCPSVSLPARLLFAATTKDNNWMSSNSTGQIVALIWSWRRRFKIISLKNSHVY